MTEFGSLSAYQGGAGTIYSNVPSSGGGNSPWVQTSGNIAMSYPDNLPAGTIVVTKWTQTSGPTLLQITLNFSFVEVNDEITFGTNAFAILAGLSVTPITITFVLLLPNIDRSQNRLGSITIFPNGVVNGALQNPSSGGESSPMSTSFSYIV